MDVLVESPPQSPSERELVARLRAGDEAAFRELVDRHHGALTRLARTFVSSAAVAEEVVQETWLGVIRGLDRFEERASLRTWIFRILVNRARTRGAQEARSIPFSSLVDQGADGDDGPAVDPDRFLGAGDRWAGHWAVPPRAWAQDPGDHLLASETRAVIEASIAGLAPAQRRVISLRDVHGWSAEEVSELMAISDGNQRVLLHRARSRVRAALEEHLWEEGATG